MAEFWFLMHYKEKNNELQIEKNNEVHTMCRKLDELSRLNVDKLYEKYPDIFCQPPIDIAYLLDRLGVFFCEQDFSEIEGKVNGISLPEQYEDVFGAVACYPSDSDQNSDAVIISVNKFDNYNRRRFTLAHELGHCMEDAENLKNGFIELRTKTTENDPKEVAINRIAAQILIPKNLIEKEYNKLYLPVLQLLAKKFEVSENVMRVRLNELGLDYIKI